MHRKKRFVGLALTVVVAVSALTLMWTPQPVRGQEDVSDEIAAALAPLRQAIDLLLANFHRPLDIGDLIRGALEGMLYNIDDPYTFYYSPNEYEELQIHIEGAYSGVGMLVEQREDAVVIQSIIPDTPAADSGLLPGDQIVQVDGQDVRGESSDMIARRVRGPEGTPVTLTVWRPSTDEYITVRLIRARIEQKAVEFELFDDELVGYIRIHQFFEGTGDEVAMVYDYFEQIGAKGVIIDLRNNPGGLLSEAIDVSRVLVPGGEIVHIVGAGGKTKTYEAPEREPGPPLVVLVDAGSASASEIVAGAIQDNKAGIIVGSRTFGKGSVQSIARLQDGGGIRFTTAEYLTPSRRSITGRGIEPDVPVVVSALAEPDEWLPLTGRYELRRGDRGLEVEGLQQRLLWLDYDAGAIDGVLGPKTEAALRNFQSDHKLPATGRLDRESYDRLIAAVAAAAVGQPLSETDAVLERALELLRSGQVPPARGPEAAVTAEPVTTGGRP